MIDFEVCGAPKALVGAGALHLTFPSPVQCPHCLNAGGGPSCKILKLCTGIVNLASSSETFPLIPSLRTPSLNKNQISSLASFLVDAAEKFPKFTRLSVLEDSCCPSEMFGSAREDHQPRN
jgi:hypothetical protein